MLLSSFTEEHGYIQTKFGKTFYRRIKSRTQNKRIPVFVLHGGPGSTHFSLLPLRELCQDRDVIFYDQIGCGLSDSLRPGLQKMSTFILELKTLSKDLKIKHFHLLGHSWGTMLGLDYYLRHPDGIRSIVFSSPCLSASQWHEDAKKLIKQLPPKLRHYIDKHEKEGTTDHKNYKAALEAYYERFVRGRVKINRTMLCARATAGSDVYQRMWGPSEFCPTGILKKYENFQFLPKVQVPTLFTCGRFDEATPKTVKAHSQLAINSEFHVFQKSAHISYADDTKNYIRVISKFLRKND